MKPFFYIFLIMLMPMQTAAKKRNAQADSLYQVACVMTDSLPVDESIEAFKRVLKIDAKYAPAYNQIAKLHLKINTVNDRQKAERAAKQAMRFDRKNLDYKLTMGNVLWLKGFWTEAAGYYKKVLKEHPETAVAAYRIGQYELNEYLNNKDRRETRSLNPNFYQTSMDQDVTPEIRELMRPSTPTISFEYFARKDMLKAANYLEKSTNIDPDFRDGYYQLGLLYLEAGLPYKMVDLMQQLLERQPDDKDALLFSGLGSYQQKKMIEASQYYTAAMAQMASEERTRIQSVNLITNMHERPKLPQLTLASPSLKPTDLMSASPRQDSLAYDRFWRKQDPLMLTELNERTLDHYGRFAYANLCFSRPSQGVEGWQTDRGKTYIRYGKPLSRKTGYGLWGGMLERWYYGGFSFVFYSKDGYFGWGHQNVRHAKRVQKEHGINRVDDPYRRQKYSMPHLVTAFRDGDQVRLELAYAIPQNRLKTNTAGDLYISDGLFAFDNNWNEVYTKPVDVILPITQSQAKQADSTHTNYFTTQHILHLDPGHYWFVAEVVDRTSLSIGTVRDSLIYTQPDSNLSLSDLLLARQIKTRTPDPKKRSDLTIIPNPLRTFRRSESVFIYLEMYNLTQNTFGQTRYNISYKLGRPRNKEISPTLFAAQDMHEEQEGTYVMHISSISRTRNGTRTREIIDQSVTFIPAPKDLINKRELAKAKTQTEITSEYQGDQKNDLTFLEINVNQLPAAIYELTVTLTDQQNQQKEEKHVIFRIVE